ncbi:hypothetical protein HYH03_008072 [Edaphochlamys debaryana]|uniref:Uncharacterized protein n=1 Tax=Edaphochlamys debaryana TaxID=47281 RepID=A0A836BYI3_9CHLO|nr:hypothetical protein HYH03_008072 [Edaphochlamys debaryana]|eukprot:KAG2493856.1 hypothetical protein HYH03_008072 [Edaphochlamys debaryana]
MPEPPAPPSPRPPPPGQSPPKQPATPSTSLNPTPAPGPDPTVPIATLTTTTNPIAPSSSVPAPVTLSKPTSKAAALTPHTAQTALAASAPITAAAKAAATLAPRTPVPVAPAPALAPCPIPPNAPQLAHAAASAPAAAALSAKAPIAAKRTTGGSAQLLLGSTVLASADVDSTSPLGAWSGSAAAGGDGTCTAISLEPSGLCVDGFAGVPLPHTLSALWCTPAALAGSAPSAPSPLLLSPATTLLRRSAAAAASSAATATAEGALAEAYALLGVDTSAAAASAPSGDAPAGALAALASSSAASRQAGVRMLFADAALTAAVTTIAAAIGAAFPAAAADGAGGLGAQCASGAQRADLAISVLAARRAPLNLTSADLFSRVLDDTAAACGLDAAALASPTASAVFSQARALHGALEAELRLGQAGVSGSSSSSSSGSSRVDELTALPLEVVATAGRVVNVVARRAPAALAAAAAGDGGLAAAALLQGWTSELGAATVDLGAMAASLGLGAVPPAVAALQVSARSTGALTSCPASLPAGCRDSALSVNGTVVPSVIPLQALLPIPASPDARAVMNTVAAVSSSAFVQRATSATTAFPPRHVSAHDYAVPYTFYGIGVAGGTDALPAGCDFVRQNWPAGSALDARAYILNVRFESVVAPAAQLLSGLLGGAQAATPEGIAPGLLSLMAGDLLSGALSLESDGYVESLATAGAAAPATARHLLELSSAGRSLAQTCQTCPGLDTVPRLLKSIDSSVAASDSSESPSALADAMNSAARAAAVAQTSLSTALSDLGAAATSGDPAALSSQLDSLNSRFTGSSLLALVEAAPINAVASAPAASASPSPSPGGPATLEPGFSPANPSPTPSPSPGPSPGPRPGLGLPSVAEDPGFDPNEAPLNGTAPSPAASSGSGPSAGLIAGVAAGGAAAVLLAALAAAFVVRRRRSQQQLRQEHEQAVWSTNTAAAAADAPALEATPELEPNTPHSALAARASSRAGIVGVRVSPAHGMAAAAMMAQAAAGGSQYAAAGERGGGGPMTAEAAGRRSATGTPRHAAAAAGMGLQDPERAGVSHSPVQALPPGGVGAEQEYVLPLRGSGPGAFLLNEEACLDHTPLSSRKGASEGGFSPDLRRPGSASASATAWRSSRRQLPHSELGASPSRRLTGPGASPLAPSPSQRTSAVVSDSGGASGGASGAASAWQSSGRVVTDGAAAAWPLGVALPAVRTTEGGPVPAARRALSAERRTQASEPGPAAGVSGGLATPPAAGLRGRAGAGGVGTAPPSVVSSPSATTAAASAEATAAETRAAAAAAAGASAPGAAVGGGGSPATARSTSQSRRPIARAAHPATAGGGGDSLGSPGPSPQLPVPPTRRLPPLPPLPPSAPGAARPAGAAAAAHGPAQQRGRQAPVAVASTSPMHASSPPPTFSASPPSKTMPSPTSYTSGKAAPVGGSPLRMASSSPQRTAAPATAAGTPVHTSTRSPSPSRAELTPPPPAATDPSGKPRTGRTADVAGAGPAAAPGVGGQRQAAAVAAADVEAQQTGPSAQGGSGAGSGGPRRITR